MTNNRGPSAANVLAGCRLHPLVNEIPSLTRRAVILIPSLTRRAMILIPSLTRRVLIDSIPIEKTPMPLPCPDADTCLMLLIRHGATQHNLEQPPRLQGCESDGPLSEIGKQQAELTSRLLQDHPIAAIYSSPLLRARQTAEAIAGRHNLDVQAVDPLCEVNVGSWGGRKWNEIERDEPEAYGRFMSDPATHGYVGGENLTQLARRVVPALEEILSNSLGQCIAVVGHSVVNRTYLAYLLGIPIGQAHRVTYDNCGVSMIQYRGGKAKPKTINSTFHLLG